MGHRPRGAQSPEERAAGAPKKAKLKTRLRKAITRLVNAELDDSWKGGGDPADFPDIEAELRAAKKALRLVLAEIKET